MDFEQSAKSRDWMERVRAFMEEHIAPAVPLYHAQSAAIDRWTEIPPIFDELKDKAQAARLCLTRRGKCTATGALSTASAGSAPRWRRRMAPASGGGGAGKRAQERRRA